MNLILMNIEIAKNVKYEDLHNVQSHKISKSKRLFSLMRALVSPRHSKIFLIKWINNI